MKKHAVRDHLLILMFDSEEVKSLIQITQLQFPNMHIMLKTSSGKTQYLWSIWSHATVVMVGEWEESIIVPPYLMFGAKHFKQMCGVSQTIIDLCQKKRWQFAGSCSSSDSSPKIFAKYLQNIC